MPAVSKAQQRFMGMVHAAQKGEEPASPEVAKVASTMKKKSAKDFASTKHKGLPSHVDEAKIQKLREYIRKTIREMNVTGNADGYQTPYAFGKPENEKKKGQKQADLVGYKVVNEASKKINVNKLKKGDKLKIKIGNDIENVEVLSNFKAGLSKFDFITLKRKVGAPYTITVSKLEKILAENRWLELKKEETPANQKIGKGISNINKQLAEMEKFLNWYGRLKQENGISNENFWKRTNGNIMKIKERLLRLEAQIRKISE